MRDIELACELIALRLPQLRQPARLCTERIKARSRCLGQYRYLSDTMRLHPRYLAKLDDECALELLDTVLHELLHKNSHPLMQLRDTLLPHPRIYEEAARLALALFSEYRALRHGDDCCVSWKSQQRLATPRFPKAWR